MKSCGSICRYSIMVMSAAVLMIHGLCGAETRSAENTWELLSPDRSIQLAVSVDREVTYTMKVDGQAVIEPSPLSMTVDDHRVLGTGPVISGVQRNSVRRQITPAVPHKFSVIDDNYNEMILSFEDHFSIVFRAYNSGAAYCFQTELGEILKVISEQAVFRFPASTYVYFPEENGFFSHNECSYHHMKLDTMSAGRLASLPVLIATDGPKVLIAESALRDYPGMWVKTAGGPALTGVYPPFPLECRLRPGSDRDMPVIKYASYLAKTSGNRRFPWRILAVARKDGDLITNQLVYQLADEQQLDDTSWIRPGKVAWDWWNANNIYGVGFRAGVNTATYKYFIDFASGYGIEYIILDEGWYRPGDILDVVPEMDVQEIIAYGKKINVGIILWVIWKTLDDQLETALDHFAAWGAAGIKVDFMQRDDQEMVNYYWKIAEEAAKRKMLVDFHGAYKPAGLRRSFPNVITREGVKGLEHNKWSRDITPEHNLTLPFIRMVPGPMDYTPGAMVNAQPDNFRIIFTRPMSMTTRAHQAAMYVIYESPLQMMSDNPSNYLREPEYTAYIASIPTVWDDTRVLEARVGDYLLLARKNGDRWYMAAMTDESPREFTVDLPFLDGGRYTAKILEDGINADRYASDYRIITRPVSRGDSIMVTLAPAGGWVAMIEKTE